MEIAIGVIAVVAVLAVVGVSYGIYLSNLVRDGSLSSQHTTPPFDIIARSEGDGRIRLRAIDERAGAMDMHHDGVFGIISADGYGQVGRILEAGPGYSVREYTPLTATIRGEEPTRLDIYAFPDDPQTAHRMNYEVVSFETELGECSAWFIPGKSRTWAVFAHGRGAHPNEALRIMPTIVEDGLPILAFNYRNDEGAPASADSWHWLGYTEWRDIEAAMQYALDNGAEDFILYGYSMGGGMCLNLLYESQLADKVCAVVLNSPLLDFGGTLDIVGQIRGYPRAIVQFGKEVAAVRFGIDWQRMNYLSRASELRAPLLVLHGEKDTLVPAELSRLLARSRPDIVQYVGFPEAEHARSWNLDPDKYNAAVREFLRDNLRDGQVSPLPSPSPRGRGDS